jgi:hypothetical protein
MSDVNRANTVLGSYTGHGICPFLLIQHAGKLAFGNMFKLHYNGTSNCKIIKGCGFFMCIAADNSVISR